MAGSSPPATPGRIFISYRREETAYPAGWLYDRLAGHFGSSQVFKDVDSIQLGDDFVEVITRAVGSCDVLIALIGNEWLTITDAHGRRRLNNPDDFVRLEIEAALSRRVRVIPVLVDGARMPQATELPDSLAALVRRQALELSPARFDFDTSRLLKVLDLTLAEVRAAQQDPAPVPAPAGTAPDPSPTARLEAPGQREQAGQGPPPGTAPAPAVPGGPPAGRARRGVLLAAAAVVIAASAIAAVVLLTGGSGASPPTGGSPAGLANPATGTFTQTSPWRLVVIDAIDSHDPGCTVTVTNTGTGEKKELHNYQTKSYQIQETGNFRWKANSRQCQVFPRPGAGKVALPFGQGYATGDTDAFHSPGRVAVEVKDFNGGSTCDLQLHDAADGHVVDYGTARKGAGPLLLDPAGRSQVYLSDLECSVRVSAAPK